MFDKTITDQAQAALRVVNHIQAMVAYWSDEERCVFANKAYVEWFGRHPEQMQGMFLKDLLGPKLYEKNLPYIQAALSGERQVFERQISLPNGTVRESIATYTPDVRDGKVRGFSVHVADVTILRDREKALTQALRERDEARHEVDVLCGMVPICAGCKAIRDTEDKWHPLESFLSSRTKAQFSHGLCPSCLSRIYPGLLFKTAADATVQALS